MSDNIEFGMEGRLQARAAFLGIPMARLFEADQITASMARAVRAAGTPITTGAYGLHTAVGRKLALQAIDAGTAGTPAEFDHIPARWVATGKGYATFRFKDGSTLRVPLTGTPGQ